MRIHFLALTSLTALSLATGCKETSSTGEGAAVYAADAAKVASGEEVLFSANSVPAPQPSPKAREGDLDGSKFKLGEGFPRERVGEFQTPGSDLTGTPRDLQGIWWMDGNPLPDETISFAKADFTQEKPLFAVFGENNFSFHAGANGTADFPQGDRDYKAGEGLFALTTAAGAVYEFNWLGSGDKKYTSARIIPTVRLKFGPIERWLRVSPRIMEFTMTKVGEHLYSRDSFVFGKQIPSYQFRRILVPSASDPKVLEKTEFWDSYAKQPGPATMRLPARK